MRRAIRQWSHRLDQRGQSAVEFLLALPVALLLLFGIFEFGRHFYTRLTLRNAVAEAARFAVTGQTLVDPSTGQPMPRSTSIVQVIVDRARDLHVDVSRIRLSPPNGGGPGEIVTIVTEPGRRSVSSPIGGNLIGNVSETSTLTSVFLATDPLAEDGINTFRLTGADQDDALTTLTIRYHTRKVGLGI